MSGWGAFPSRRDAAGICGNAAYTRSSPIRGVSSATLFIRSPDANASRAGSPLPTRNQLRRTPGSPEAANGEAQSRRLQRRRESPHESRVQVSRAARDMRYGSLVLESERNAEALDEIERLTVVYRARRTPPCGRRRRGNSRRQGPAANLSAKSCPRKRLGLFQITAGN